MKSKLIFHKLLAISFLLSACLTQKPLSSDTLVSQNLQPSIKKTLTICLGEEPDSLFLYSSDTHSAKLIRQAIYDGPIDIEGGDAQPVILEKIPDFNDGSAFIIPVEVSEGNEVINSTGEQVQLKAGVEVFPAGCVSPQCAITWDGVSPLKLDIVSAEFELLPGLKWSDGLPLKASDSVYSFKLASALDSSSKKNAIEQTATYISLNDFAVQWTSKPGLVTDSFEKYFFSPLPEHAWGKYNKNELLSTEEVNRTPIGWGAYQVEEWIKGQSLRLEKNPHYWRSGEDLPFFDELVFKFINPFGDTALSNIKFDRTPFQQFNYDLGEFEDEIAEHGCDLTTTTSDLRDQIPVINILLNYFKDPAIKVIKSGFSEDQIILFRMSMNDGSAPNPLNDLNVRKAINQCVNRSKMIKDLSFGLYDTVNPGQLLSNAAGSPTDPADPYDPISGEVLLDQSGWKDSDNNPETPRISMGVPGFTDGKELGFQYLVEDIDDNLMSSEIAKASLAECGIGINIKPIPSEIFWDALNTDSVFQGNYDLVQLSLKTPISDPCQLFSSRSIPTDENNSLGLNFSNFRNGILDNACNQIEKEPLRSERKNIFDQLSMIINDKLPIVSLYRYSDLMIAQRDFCTETISNQSVNELSRIEDFIISPECR